MQCARAGELEEELQKQKRMLQELKDQLSRAKSQKDEVASKLANLMQELAMWNGSCDRIRAMFLPQLQ